MNKLYYIHDPMCSWCYAFRPALQELISQLSPEVVQIRLLGGLAADTDEPMSDSIRCYIRDHWQRIEEHVPGTYFNYAYWDINRPKRSTYPACRAVIAARNQGARYDVLMTEAIQNAYYREARDTSDPKTLVEIAAQLGLDVDKFRLQQNSAETQALLNQEIQKARQLGTFGFPSLVFKTLFETLAVPIDYKESNNMLAAITPVLLRATG